MAEWIGRGGELGRASLSPRADRKRHLGFGELPRRGEPRISVDFWVRRTVEVFTSNPGVPGPQAEKRRLCG